MKVKIKFYNETVDLDIQIGQYSNGRLAIMAVDCNDGSRFGNLTTNLPDEPLGAGEIFVKTYSENEVWVPQVLAAFPDKFIPTGRKVKSGHVEIPVYKFVGDQNG